MVKNNQGQKNNGFSRFKKIKLRTMDSDKKSIQEQGGGAPKPYSPGETGNSSAGQTPFPSSNNEGGQNSSQNFPPQSGSSQFPPVNKGSDQNNQGGESFPPKPTSMPGEENASINKPSKEGDGGVKPIGPEMPAGKKGKPGKKLFISLLVVILVVGLLAVGYFFVYPEFIKSDSDLENGSESEIEESTPAEGAETEGIESEATSEEEDFDVPMGPAEEGEDDLEEEESAEESAETGEIPSDNHISLFSTPADSTVKKVLATVNLENIKSALEISSTEVPIFREIILTDEEDNLIQSAELLSVIAPNTFSSEIQESVEADSTLFTYTDEGGTWFGLVLNAKSSADLAQLKSSISQIEENTSEVKNFFLSDPGSETSWKDGSAHGVASRYLSFSAENASFNYGWSGNALIISGSYSSFGEAINHL
jgi:hypothetical protein